MANKSILTQGGDGTAIPAGMVGEAAFGATKSGTNGKAYVDYTATAANLTATGLISDTLNKGSYLCVFTISQKHANAAELQSLYVYLQIGGTTVWPSTGVANHYATSSLANEWISISGSVPIDITADGVTVGVIGLMTGSYGASDGLNTLSFVRLG